jgi:phosphoribosyl 1,2-cyclic phosphodiesterase
MLTLSYSILASGSSGNALYVQTEQTRLLIDAGLSGKKITGLLDEIGVQPEYIQAILVTHEHRDHIQGLGVMARRYNIPVYANDLTWKELDPLCGSIQTEQKFHFEREERLTLGDIEIESYGISHDAACPMSFCFHHNGRKLSVATDLGYVSDKIKGTLSESDVLVFEANHDVDMLRMGAYPWNVKRRIMSDVGHLSNEASGEALVDIIHDRTKKVYLAHLSQDNNMRDLARMTVEQTLQKEDLPVGERVTLCDTYPDRPTPLTSV